MKNTLKGLRGHRTLQEAAQGIGIDPDDLSIYEAGKRVPRDEIKRRIADFYHVPVDSIFQIG